MGLLVLACPQMAIAQAGASMPQQTFVVESQPFFDTRRANPKDSIVLVQPMGMTRLPSGTVVVGDNRAPAVRFFGSDGRLQRNFGRNGSGPNEFLLVQLIGHCGSDRILVSDQANRRLTYLTFEGAFESSRQVLNSAASLDCGRSGMLVETRPARRSIPEQPMAHRGRLTVLIRKTDDTIAKPLFEVAGDDRQRWPSSDGPRPLGRRTTIAVGSDRFFVGTGDSALVHVYRFSGEKLPSIILPFRTVRVERNDIDSYLEYLAKRNPSVSRQRIQDSYGQLEYPKTFPLHGAMLVASDGRLWVEEYRSPAETQSRWVVFDPNGRLVTTLELPDGFRLAEVGRDYLLGSWRDEDDLDHVRAYRFRESRK